MDFENVMEIIKKEKGKIFIFSFVFILFIILVSFINNIVENYNDKKSLEKTLVVLGEKVYTDAYYDNLKKNPEEYKDNGIKITLEDIFEIINLENKDYFYNRKTKEECDTKNSYVRIYPKAPYGVNDYELDFVLACGY